MKYSPNESGSKSAAGASPLKRRGMLFGTGVAALAGVVAAVASRTDSAPAPESVPPASQDVGADGYRLSHHVLRYYETARV